MAKELTVLTDAVNRHKAAGRTEAIGHAWVKDGTRRHYRVVYRDNEWGFAYVIIDKSVWPFYEYTYRQPDPDGTMYGHI